MLGEMSVQVIYQQSSYTLTLFVAEGSRPSLLGRSWLQHICLDWKSLGVATVQKVPDVLRRKYADVFRRDWPPCVPSRLHCVSRVMQFQNSIGLDQYHLLLKRRLGKKLDRLEALGVLERVSHSRWAAPLVPVPKKDRQLRLCGDFKVTINPVMQVDQYPLPKSEDPFTTLVGGQKFTKLDLKQAYQQMQLEEDAKDLVTINTHQGLTGSPGCHSE